MIYFDAAYVAKFYLDEPDSERVRSVGDNAGEVACCVHGRIEVISVFHRKMRERAFAPKVFAAVCDQFDTDCEALVWEWLPISAALIADLSKRLQQLPTDVFIRAADALHLGSAAEQGFKEIYSNDRHLLAAAPHFGLLGISV
jgi:predicted nucleic acid-binding protein